MYTYVCTLDRVVDGDTVDVLIDLGFRIQTKQRVRLAGINAPEHNTAAGQKAKDYVERWFAVSDDQFVLSSNKPGGGDKYGRYLAVISDAQGSVLNDDLVAEGHAKPWDGQGSKPT